MKKKSHTPSTVNVECMYFAFRQVYLLFAMNRMNEKN